MSSSLRVLLWLALLHAAALFLFTKGFLLTRHALPHRARVPDTALATHARAVLLVVDALRFDFVSSHPPAPPSAFHHHVLTLPAELTAAHPHRSFLFNAHADPPTATLQRIKGLTTGSLPTFVDAGDNFGGAAVTEDSLLHQLVAAGRQVAFAGDDTWTTLFPGILDHNMSFPFDSFNVEDLHTVDEGVVAHLLPLVTHHAPAWGLAIGHGLGVDHVGHRVGPDHPAMQAKLAQMDVFLRELVAALDDETLFILLGDHGMDRRGNHGGDSALETMSAVWVYSKGPALAQGTALPSALVPTVLFPGETVPQRAIQQIDLVPTIALLLGLPIPFNNLGSVIPELFDRGADGLQHALERNAHQIKTYLDAYRASPSGGELDAFWSELSASWSATRAASPEDALVALWTFSRRSLSVCRTLWARFSLSLMGAGLIVMLLSIVATYCAYNLLGDDTEERLQRALSRAFRGAAVGLVLGSTAYLALRRFLEGVHLHHAALFGSALASALAFTLPHRPRVRVEQLTSIPIVPVLHALCFASNSFVVWEDRIVLFLLMTSLVPAFLAGFTAPTPRLRYRILGFSTLFAVCVRLMAISTVCREEQHPYCSVTFYVSPTSSAPPVFALLLAPVAAIATPLVLWRVLGTSKSDKGVAALFFPWALAGVLLAGTACWVLEWAHATGHVGDAVRRARTVLAQACAAGLAFGGLPLWWALPVCLAVQTDGAGAVAVLGFANAFGAPYLVWWTLVLGAVWLCTQLTGQVVLGLAAVAFLAHLEAVDSVRDARALRAACAAAPTRTPTVSFGEVIPLALLAVHAFHGTGHQAAFASVQWKTAFVWTPTVSVPASAVSVVLNTLGPHVLMGLGVPLLGLWNVAPRRGVALAAGRAGLGMMAYSGLLVLGSAGSAAVLRRHLMVWKVFAPRYVFAACALGAVDLGVVLGVGIGVGRVRERIEGIFHKALSEA